MSTPMDKMRTHQSDQLDRVDPGEKVRVAGWVESVRHLGSLVFIMLRDSTGLSQLIAKKGSTPADTYNEAKGLTSQSCIMCEGTIQTSKAKDHNVEVSLERLIILSHALHPLPLDMKGNIDSGLDVRLDARALDLRNPVNTAIFRIRHHALQSIRRTLIEEGFFEVNTSRIISQAAEGGSTLFTVDYFGKKAYLAQSPQLYKEQLTLSLEKVFEVGTFFRAEKSHTTRHLNEFTSIDVEAAFLNDYDVMKTCELIVSKCLEDVSVECKKDLMTLGVNLRTPQTPFDVITYKEVINDLQSLGETIDEKSDLTDRHLSTLGTKHKSFYFITEWPESLKPFYIAEKDGSGISRSFDLQCGMLELASGGMRIHSRELLERRLERAGLTSENFSSHLRTFDWGMPPHSGWGLGFDRLMMILTGKRNIRDVVLFPRDEFRLMP